MGSETDKGSAIKILAEQPADDIRQTVRSAYGKVAREQTGCCGPSSEGEVSWSGCCGTSAEGHAEAIGYGQSDLDAVPDGANLGLGCGNPTAIADLKPGEVVLDLGAGAGFDAFIAAQQVGPEGRVIGVDMTPEMLERSRRLAVESGVAGYVEFREGIISKLPVVDDSVDVIMSNCVINLVPDKGAAFREAFRVLKPGGRLAVSDILLTKPIPDELRNMASLYVSCVAGALLVDDYLGAIEEAGFVEINFTRASAGKLLPSTDDPLVDEAVRLVGEEGLQAMTSSIWSYKINAIKP